MAIKIVKKKLEAKPNVIVYGRPMHGKTTWVKSQVDNEKTLYISTDHNALPGCYVAEVENFGELQEAIEIASANKNLSTIVLDVLDDAVSFAEKKAENKLGMNGKADAKGAYNRFTNTVGELIKESVLRPLLNSGKQLYVVMHSAPDREGSEVPCFGTYTSDAMSILNWLKGRSGKVVFCSEYGGVYEATVESERNYEDAVPEPTVKPAKKTKAKEQVPEMEPVQAEVTEEKED